MKYRPLIAALFSFGILFSVLCFNVYSYEKRSPKQVKTLIPYQGGVISITSVEQESQKGIFTASGNVEIHYQHMFFSGDYIQYNSKTHELVGKGSIVFSDNKQIIHCDHFNFNIKEKSGEFYKIRAVTDKNFHVISGRVDKLTNQTYIFRHGRVTTCMLKTHPHWSFSATYAKIVKDKTAVLHNSLFRLFGVPVFYFPWIKMPILKKERKSGFLIPGTGYSNQKGRKVTDALYLTLGRSADLLIRGDYFAKRGFGIGVSFRSKLSDIAYFDFDSYSVNDREHQGGSAINIKSFFSFGEGFHGAISANVITNIIFRKIYEDSFIGAIRPDEAFSAYFSKEWGDYGVIFNIERRQFYFEKSQIISRSTPEISFNINGKQFFNQPIFFFFDSSIGAFFKKVKWREYDSFSGHDVSKEFITPRATQRFDFYPRFLIPLKLWGLFNISFMPAMRVTFYSDSLPLEEQAQTSLSDTSSESITRKIASLETRIDLPRLYAVFRIFGMPIKHILESGAIWRWTTDVDNYSRVIQFNSMDAIAGTDELEYFLTNRFIGMRDGMPWEWASLTLRQKYFIDPTFNHHLIENRENMFESLYDFSPYEAAYIQRRFSPIQAIARFNPTSYFSGDARVEYDTVFKTIRDWSLGTTLQKDWLFTSVAYLRLKSFEDQMVNNNYLQTSFGIGKPGKGLSFDINVSYNFENSNRDNMYMRLNYYTDCLGISVEFSNFDIIGRRQERELRFSLYLKGIGRFGKMRNLGRRYF